MNKEQTLNEETNGNALNDTSIKAFILSSKIKKKLLSETSWFLAANLIYSASTYIIGFLVPYLLNTNYMAYFTSGNQIIMVLAFIFEFGLSVSFLRFYQLDRAAKYINSYLQAGLFGLIGLIALFFSTKFNTLFNLDHLPVESSVFYFLVIGQLAWVFIKNWLLAVNKIKSLIAHAVVIFCLRALFLVHLYYIRKFSIEQLFFETLLFPFAFALIHLSIVNTGIILKSFRLILQIKKETLRSVILRAFYYFKFSMLTYISGFLYLYSVRYLIIYLTGKDNTAVADIGYAMTFIGIILVFYTSFRSYLIARLNINQASFISLYIKNLKAAGRYLFLGIIFGSLFLSYLVYLIKPHYLTFNAVVYSFILFVSNFLNVYFGMFTVLSKTYDFNKLEVMLNIIRLLLVIIVTNSIVTYSLLSGILAINLIMVTIEAIFAVIITRRIQNEKIQYSKIPV